MAFEKGVGIGILDHTICIAQVSHGGSVDFIFQKELPAGLVKDNILKRPELFESTVQKLLKEKGVRGLGGNVTMIVPDSRVFLATFLVNAKMKQKERDEEVLKRSQKQIPVPFKKAVIDLELGVPKKGKQPISVFAVEKDTIKSLESMGEYFQMPVVVLEDRNTSTYRVLEGFLDERSLKEDVKVIVDVNFEWINLTLFDVNGLPIFIRSVKLDSVQHKEKIALKKLSASHAMKICGSIKETVGFFKKIDKNPKSIYLSGIAGADKALLTSCKDVLKGYAVHRVSDVVFIDSVASDKIDLFCSVIGAATRAARPRKYNSLHNFKDALSYDA